MIPIYSPPCRMQSGPIGDFGFEMQDSSNFKIFPTFDAMIYQVCCLILFLLLSSTAAFAQQRPLVTEDPHVLPEGTVVTEAGFAYLHRARFPVSGLEGDQYSVLVTGIHIGIGSRAEFQITGVAQNFLKLHGSGAGWRNDWGDFSLSTKIKIVDEGRARPIISFRPTVVLPNTNNEKGLGTDGTHFFGNLLFGKTFGPARVFGNLGLGILDDAVRPAAQQDAATYGIAGFVRLNSLVDFSGEWNGWSNPQENPTPGGEDRGQVRFGLGLRALGGRWDVGGVAGTTRWDPKVGAVVGFTKEFRAWR